MSRYIDADKLYSYIQKEKAWKQGRIKKPRYEQGLYDAFYEMLEIIDAQPKADVKEVVRGEWKDLDFGIVECTNCKFVEEVVFNDCENQCNYKFCPDCGADMRGDG